MPGITPISVMPIALLNLTANLFLRGVMPKIVLNSFSSLLLVKLNQYDRTSVAICFAAAPYDFLVK